MMDVIERFLAHLATERRLAENTVTAYRNDLRQFARFVEGGQSVRGSGHAPDGSAEAVTRDLVLGYVLSLKETNGYAPATVARKIAALKALCHYLHMQGMLSSDPTVGIGAPEVKKPLPRPAGVRDIAALLDQASRRAGPEGMRDRAMLRLLYATGMRVSELVSLNEGDVDYENGLVRCVGRGGRQRSIPVDRATIAEVRTYAQVGRGEIVRADPRETALFVNHRGQRLTRQGFWLIMKVLAHDAGIQGPLTPHMLRHSFAAHRLHDGVALGRLKEMLGHANIATTQVYTLLPIESAAVDAGVRRNPVAEPTSSSRP
jgi:integrase/recombinase XerD